jgi:deoxycytidylate deaminase
MPSPKGDPTYIKDKDRFFMNVARTIELASTHPSCPGGCVLVRNREIIGDGRSILTASKIEVDCLTHAIATAAKRGTPTTGSVVYTTRYPFSPSVFQCYVMGVRQIYVRSLDWEPYYKDEFRRAARLARELSISIEPIFDKPDPQYSLNLYEDQDLDKDLFETTKDHTPDEFDSPEPGETNDKPTSV